MKKIQKLVALVAIALASSSFLVAQNENQPQQTPPLETHYMVDFTAYRVTDPGITLSAEWMLTPEWVLAGEVGVGYAMLYAMASNNYNQFFLDDGISARWYVNRARRARLGKTIRKNSGFYFDFGLKHMYTASKVAQRRYPGTPYYDEYGQPAKKESSVAHANVLGAYIAAGSKLVSKSNIYFSWKLGLGYGVGITSSNNEMDASPTLFPVCDIRVGYCF